MDLLLAAVESGSGETVPAIITTCGVTDCEGTAFNKCTFCNRKFCGQHHARDSHEGCNDDNDEDEEDHFSSVPRTNCHKKLIDL